MLQRKPLPIGISASNPSASGLGVALSGSVSGLSTSLTPGKVYYTNTKGNLVAAANYAGHSNSMALAGLNGQSKIYYIYDSANNAYVSLNSKVGLATSSDTLFVQTALS